MSRVSFIKILFLYPILFYQNCMDTRSSDCYNNDWSNKVVDCGGTLVIGRFIYSDLVTKQFSNLKGRNFIFGFTIVKFDSWDPNDLLQVLKDDVIIDTFSYYAYQGIQKCFRSEPELFDLKSYQFTLPQGQTQVKFSLQGHFDEGLDNEGWGIKRIYIELSEPCVEFYSECNYQGDLWKICRGNQTTQVRQIPFQIKSIQIEDGIQVKMRDPKYLP